MAYSYNTTTKKITVTATSTTRSLYDDVQTVFSGASYMQYLNPMQGNIKDALYTLTNGWTFDAQSSIDYLNTGGIKDSAGDNIWTNVNMISGDTFTGLQTWINQAGTITTPGATGLVNMLLKVRAGGSDINSKAYTVYARKFQKRYSQFTTTASSGGVDAIPLSTSADPNLTIAEATIQAYVGLSITWGSVTKDAGDGAGVKPYAIVIDGGGKTLKEVYNWVQYQLLSASDIDAGAGTHIGKITDELIAMAGSTVTTKTGVWVENFAAADANNIIYTDSNGDTHTPPLTVPVTVNSTVSGCQMAVFALDNTGYDDSTYTPAHISSTLLNTTAVGLTASTSLTYSADVPVLVMVRKAGYEEYHAYLTITNAGLTVNAQNPVASAY